MSPDLIAVGDIMLGENLHHFGRGIPCRYAGRWTELICPELREIINQADLLFGNFEGCLLGDQEWSKAGLVDRAYSAPASALCEAPRLG